MKAVSITNSSLITSVRYRRKTDNLTITFTSGRTYRYFDVPARVYEALIDAKNAGESLGVFFNVSIKGLYDYEEV